MTTETELLDWLQKQLNQARYTGKAIFRWSEHGRGWRLHETSLPSAKRNIREIIKEAILAEKETAHEPTR